MRYLSILIILILTGCDSGISSDANNKNKPDTTTWSTALDRGIGYSYRAAPQVCVNFGPYNNRHVNMVNAGKRKISLTYLFYVKPDSSVELPATKQLKLLESKGLLESSVVEIDGRRTKAYSLTVRGWGLAYYASIGGLCLDAGRTTVAKILDYQLLPDQASGLVSYNVKYETGIKLRKWVDSKVIKTFDYNVVLPRIHEAILVKGPKGYYFPTTQRMQRNISSILPSPEAVAQFTKRDKFLKKSCEYHSCAKNVEESIKVYYVGIPKGNMIQFRFSYTTGNGETKMGVGYLKVTRKGEWIVDNSISSRVMTIEKARLIRKNSYPSI